MKIVMGLIALASLVAIPAGLIMCIFRRYRPKGKQIAFYGGALLVFVFSFAVFQGSASTDAAVQQSPTMANQPKSAPPTYAEVLAKLRVSGFSWEKKGFGSLMSATFVLHNDSPVSVKDIQVKCSHSANSGTVIDSNTRTVYEVVPSRSYHSVVNIDMGFIHSEIVQSKCCVVSYSAVG